MKSQDGQIRLSATDLANHLACRHLTTLDLAEARGHAKRPIWNDPALAVLRERGFQHEASYLDYLRSRGHSVVRLDDLQEGDSAFEKTKAAMQAGEEIIVQATLANDRWFGRADILQRVDRPSKLGEWSYEVIDTKLARETRAGTILQLCLYSDIVCEVQGTPPEHMPEHMYVVSPARGLEPEEFRIQDYLAYYRFVKRRLETEVDRSHGSLGASTYPDPVSHCDICLWLPDCKQKRHDDDHLCLVAGISKLQRTELQDRGIHSLESLADIPVPLSWRPKRGSSDGYERVREQARVQREGRRKESPVHELLPPEVDRGLARLPEPSAGDIFFDIEGDLFVGDSGLEYLFGYVVFDDSGEPTYRQQWALNQKEERGAFETFVDFVMDRLSRFPDLHIYHFAPYEPSALKRLMGRYATKEEEVDRMLRARLFVDLHAIVKQGVRASVERYSLKELEIFFGFERDISLADALPKLLAVERALELGHVAELTEETRSVVESYNRDDCLSARQLRDWLESERARLVDEGEQVPRPTPQSGEPSETIDERRQRALFLMDKLLQDVPTERDERSDEQQSRWLLAHMLEWHRREDKAPWWEFYRLRDLSDEELVDEKGAVSGLGFVERVGGAKRSPVDRYQFQPQETKIRGKETLYTTDGEKFGDVAAIDLVAGTIDIKKRGAVANVHPSALFAHLFVSSAKLSDSLLELARWVASNGIDADGPYRAARDLVLRRSPRLLAGVSELQRKDEDTVAATKRLALELDGGVLPIQGPPGSGKTYTGARMICELVKAGKKVGVTAVSHRVIRKLLEGYCQVNERRFREWPLSGLLEGSNTSSWPLSGARTEENGLY